MKKYPIALIGLFIFITSVSVTKLAEAASNSSVDKRPNIVLVLTDDHGYGDVGFNLDSSPDIKTPNLDALAKNGIIFDSAYVAHPFCGPSRAALMTGRYPHKIGADFNIPSGGNGKGIDKNEMFISKALQQAGYFTGAMGKWHLGETADYHPNVRGFDEYYGFLGGGHNYFPDDYRARYESMKKRGMRSINDYLTPLEHNGVEVKETEYITDALSREAVNFVNKASKKDQPFFLYLAYNAPHTPLEATKEDLAKFSHIKDEKRRTYAAMVYAVDRGVKTLVDALKANNEYENTLIVFMSDNGGKLSQGGVNKPLREGKGSAHEGGHRVPMVVHWANKAKPNQRYPHPISSLDFYPTFLSVAGVDIPTGKVLDGVNFLPILNTQDDARPEQNLYIMRHRGGAHDVSIRRGNLKAVRTVKTGKWQLFDLSNDIGENNDIASKHELELRNMVGEMAYWAWTNVEPQWFHIHEEGDAWRSTNMPRYGETFSLDE